mmetsp:Transcript_43849/g.92216  ORF Transcript_43849/g.92216 Transcript_43849/m.92216 type:complete len:547 (+) Transcript_43849:199-1839(+)
MARSKNSRSWATSNNVQPACHLFQCYCRCIQCVTDRNLSGQNTSAPASLGHRSPQDVMDSIDYHWRVLSSEVKHFLLKNPQETYLRKLIDFWLEPCRIGGAKGSCASSISGSSWFLALNYLYLEKLVEAQALILHGAFIMECARRPIQSISIMCDSSKGFSLDVMKKNLPIFHDALASTSTKHLMESFLQIVLPPDYRRRMIFACQAGKANGHSIVEDYVKIISNDWKSASSSSAASVGRNMYTHTAGTTIEVVLKDEMNKESRERIEEETKLKSIFRSYANKQGVSLRSLRFKHAGKILFLSTAGNKTAEQIGIKHLDIIHVSSTTSSSNDAESSCNENPSRQRQLKTPSKSKKCLRHTRRINEREHTHNKVTHNYEEDKILHSKNLSRVFDEVQPILKSIRQRINSLNIERTLPKQKKQCKKTSKAAVAPVWNPSTAGIGGKAGKSHFLVHVGDTCNLYKTTKRSATSSRKQKPIVTDLHGLNKEEALSKLDSMLPRWKETAMLGEYPFVIPVNIVCGGGNQILSEAVENWVRQNENIANAPKS